MYSDVPTLSSPPQINRSAGGGTGYDLPISPPSYSGRSGGTGYDLPIHPPSYSGRSGGTGYDVPWSPPQYSGSDNGYGTNEGPQQQYGRGADGSAGYGATFAQQQPASRPFRSFGWDQRYACHNTPPVNGGLSNSIAQGQGQRDVGVDDQEEGQRPSTEVEYHGEPLSEVFRPPESVEQQRAATEMDCHGGPVSEVSGPPEATASLARGGLPSSDDCNHPAGHSPPTAVSSDSALEEWLQSDEMEMSMFSLSEGQRQQPPKHMAISTAEGQQQSAPTAVALAAAAPAAAAVTGTCVFPAVSSKGVVEAPASSAGAASAAVSAAAPATGGNVFPTASMRGAARAPDSADGAALTAAWATGGNVHSASLVGGALAPSAVEEASAEISAAEPATSGTVPPAASIREAVGARESSTGVVSSDAEAEAAPSTAGTASPIASAARAARKLPSVAGSTGEICGERGASTHPFDLGTGFSLEVHYYNGSWLLHGSSSSSNSSSSGSSSSSSDDNTSVLDSWWDATCVGALPRPFDPGKRCRRSARRGNTILGVDLPFDRGKAWGRMQHGG